MKSIVALNHYAIYAILTLFVFNQTERNMKLYIYRDFTVCSQSNMTNISSTL